MIIVSEHSDPQKTRRSLYAASFFTFAVANAEFLSNEISLFGLKLRVEQVELVALGRFAVAVLLVIFLLHIASRVTAGIKTFAKNRFELDEEQIRTEVAAIERQLEDPSGYYHTPREPESWEEDAHQAHLANQSRMNRLIRVDLAYTTFHKFLLEYALVFLFSGVALCNPKIGGWVLNAFQM